WRRSPQLYVRRASAVSLIGLARRGRPRAFQVAQRGSGGGRGRHGWTRRHASFLRMKHFR
ncbi:MAG: hypothetical protein ACRD1S_19890, partial [Vicinamibacterales bacterium]